MPVAPPRADAARAAVPPQPARLRWARWVALAVGCGAIALLWLVVFPALGSQRAIRSHIERNRAAGIHPDAMFYTEVGAIDGVKLVYEQGQPTGQSIRMGE